MKRSKETPKPAGTKLAVTTIATPKHQEEVNFVEVRKSIANLVGNAAEIMVDEAIRDAKSGHLARMKYLFEAVGLYPPAPVTLPELDQSLAATLLKKLGIPTEPIMSEEEANACSTNLGKPEIVRNTKD
jgi:hypothetical protein